MRVFALLYTISRNCSDFSYCFSKGIAEHCNARKQTQLKRQIDNSCICQVSGTLEAAGAVAKRVIFDNIFFNILYF